METKLPEFGELKSMMILFKKAVKEEVEAKIIMDLKENNFENSEEASLCNKQERWDKQSILESSFTNFININKARKYTREVFCTGISKVEDDSELARLEEMRTLIDQYEKEIIEGKALEKKRIEDDEIFNKAYKEHCDKEEHRERVQKDLSSSLFDAAKDLDEEIAVKRERCNVCFKKYDRRDREFCILQCRHPTCLKCLNEMPEKLCPICEKPFTKSDIIKVSFN